MTHDEALQLIVEAFGAEIVEDIRTGPGLIQEIETEVEKAFGSERLQKAWIRGHLPKGVNSLQGLSDRALAKVLDNAKRVVEIKLGAAT